MGIAPSSTEKLGSKTRFSNSNFFEIPSPLHVGQAPSGELNEKSLGSKSG